MTTRNVCLLVFSRTARSKLKVTFRLKVKLHRLFVNIKLETGTRYRTSEGEVDTGISYTNKDRLPVWGVIGQHVTALLKQVIKNNYGIAPHAEGLCLDMLLGLISNSYSTLA
jgi:hypothetical protein